MSRVIYITLFLIQSFLLTGCAHFSAETAYSGPIDISKKHQDSYNYQKYQGIYTDKLIEKNSHYTLQRITFPSKQNTLSLQHDITIDYYAINTVKKAPVVLVLPIFGGSNEVAIYFASYFAKHGFATAIVHRQNKYKKIQYMEQTDSIMRQIIFDHKQALDWVESRPELDAERIGVFGVSMGGVKGALISALDPRIDAAIIALAGGDLPYLLAQSTDNRIMKDREQLLAEKKLSQAEFEQQLSQRIECDPLNYAQYIDANKTLIILALFDTVIPFKKGVELREKIGNPETIYLLSGHYSALLYIPYVQYQSRKFLQKHLQ